MTASKSSRFAKGSGVYTCNCCNRQTRSTGRGDNEHIQLCAECYDLAGFDNQVSDEGIGSLTPENLSDIRTLIATITSKGGEVDSAFQALLRTPEETKVEANKFEAAAAAHKAAASAPEADPAEYHFYLVTITGPDFEETILPVDAVKSSQARRMAKQILKAEGLSIDGLTFNARKA